MPTTTTVLKGVELLVLGTKKYMGWGKLIVVDIGGAITDIHSVSELKKEESNKLEGLRESFLKRIVVEDMGMRYSALSSYENYKEDFLDHGLEEKNIIERCNLEKIIQK